MEREQAITRASLAVAFALASGACIGQIGDGDSSNAGPSAGGAGADGGAETQASVPLSWPVTYTGTPSGLRRLTRDELVTTLQDLTGSAPSREDLPAEPRHGRGALLASGLAYIANELPKLDTVLDDFTTKVAPSLLTKSGCTATGQAQQSCLVGWATAFGVRAMRRPLRADESAAYQTLLGGADGTAAADADAVASVLHAIVFSPSFLYRTEVGTPSPGQIGVRVLGGEELATRLSYLATLAPPDDALLASASAGRLADPTERSAELARLVRTDRGKHALAVLVLEWLGANEPTVHTKSAGYLAGLPDDFEAQVRTSAEGAIASALFGAGKATLGNLLSTSSYLADPVVKTLEQPSGTGATATGDTKDTVRAGILMHPQVLVGHTKEDGVSPFQLGAWMREDLLCQPPPAPPADAQAKALGDVAGLTMRENFEHRVSGGQNCIACHGTFAPLGYSFLPFDPVGRWLEQDPTGKPWDLAGSIPIFSGSLDFSSPRDLVQNLGSAPQVHGCFAQAAFQWAHGRLVMKEDEGTLAALDAVVKATDGDVLAVLDAIVSAPEFATALAAR